MALRCFYVVNGEAAGPVKPEELLQLGRSGAFSAENLVWIEGTADWQPFTKWADGFEAANPRVLEPQPPPPQSSPQPQPAFAPTPEPAPSPSAHAAPTAGVPVSEEVPPADAPAKSNEEIQTVDPGSGGWFRKISWASFVLLVLSVCLFVAGVTLSANKLGPTHTVGRIVFGIAVVGALSSLIGALIGVVGFIRYRKWFILAPTLLTLVILSFFSATIVIPGFLRARARALDRAQGAAVAPSKPLTPVQTVPGAMRITHPTLGFSFDVPAGFVEFPASNPTLKLWKVFGRPSAPGELAEVFGVQPLGTTLPHRHLEAKDLPKDKEAVISQISWRGTMVDAFRLSETNNGKQYISYNVQIPLKTEAIQLMFGAPADRETELKSRVNTLLASLDGQSDW